MQVYCNTGLKRYNILVQKTYAIYCGYYKYEGHLESS